MADYDEYDLIDSPLSQIYSKDGKWVDIKIYRLPYSDWAVEVVDEYNNSTVWDDEFKSDLDALNFVLEELQRDGIDEFIGQPSNRNQ